MRGLLRYYIHYIHSEQNFLAKYGLTQNFFPFLLNEIKHGKNPLLVGLFNSKAKINVFPLKRISKNVFKVLKFLEKCSF